METTVTVWGKQVPLKVSQKSKSVWVASGTYMNGLISVQDRSANSALKRWAESAKYKGG